MILCKAKNTLKYFVKITLKEQTITGINIDEAIAGINMTGIAFELYVKEIASAGIKLEIVVTERNHFCIYFVGNVRRGTEACLHWTALQQHDTRHHNYLLPTIDF